MKRCILGITEKDQKRIERKTHVVGIIQRIKSLKGKCDVGETSKKKIQQHCGYLEESKDQEGCRT